MTQRLAAFPALGSSSGVPSLLFLSFPFEKCLAQKRRRREDGERWRGGGEREMRDALGEEDLREKIRREGERRDTKGPREGEGGRERERERERERWHGQVVVITIILSD
jgi:hypothetical protein